jgi:hypothetical protein
MRLLLILIASSGLICSCGAKFEKLEDEGEQHKDSITIDSIILTDSIPVVQVIAEDCVQSSHTVCTKRMEQEAEHLEQSYDSILHILEKKIDSAKLRKIVNKKLLRNGKKKIIRLQKKRDKIRQKQKESGYYP